MLETPKFLEKCTINCNKASHCCRKLWWGKKTERILTGLQKRHNGKESTAYFIFISLSPPCCKERQFSLAQCCHFAEEKFTVLAREEYFLLFFFTLLMSESCCISGSGSSTVPWKASGLLPRCSLALPSHVVPPRWDQHGPHLPGQVPSARPALE